MRVDQQLLIRVDVLKKEAEQSLRLLSHQITTLEEDINNKRKQREQIKGMITGFNQVSAYYKELETQPEELRTLEGMK